ncbi:MAG: hypothetical protein HY744_26165 [Deltaproteobacteria bacterium]|nr:hypothetical protein [Deltaproteobacteria bacterium]
MRELADWLGQALAGYWLKTELRTELGIATPKPWAGRHGAAVALFAPTEQVDGLAEGLPLPMQWRREAADSDMVPAGLSTVAESVRRELGIDGWGLALARDLDDYDLSELPLAAESAWAALAAALVVACEGGAVRPWVFATGAWDGHGIARVEHIKAKLAAVRSLGWAPEGQRPVLWVPAGNYDEARAAITDEVELKSYPAGETKARQALSEHLYSIEVPPTTDEPLARRRDYANRPYSAVPGVPRWPRAVVAVRRGRGWP